jgi:hypothetical protein
MTARRRPAEEVSMMEDNASASIQAVVWAAREGLL